MCICNVYCISVLVKVWGLKAIFASVRGDMPWKDAEIHLLRLAFVHGLEFMNRYVRAEIYTLRQRRLVLFMGLT